MNTSTLLASAEAEISRRGLLWLRFCPPDPAATPATAIARLVNSTANRCPRAAILAAIDEWAAGAIERAPGASLTSLGAAAVCRAHLAARGIEVPHEKQLCHLLKQIVGELHAVKQSHHLKTANGTARGWCGLRLRSVMGNPKTPDAVASAA